MFCRDARLSRLRDERVARLYGKSLLLKILFVISNDFWISNDDFGFISKSLTRVLILLTIQNQYVSWIRASLFCSVLSPVPGEGKYYRLTGGCATLTPGYYHITPEGVSE